MAASKAEAHLPAMFQLSDRQILVDDAAADAAMLSEAWTLIRASIKESGWKAGRSLMQRFANISVADCEQLQAAVRISRRASLFPRCASPQVTACRLHVNGFTDSSSIQRLAPSASSAVVAVLSLHQQWAANWAGELAFYEDGAPAHPRGGSAMSFLPRPGRVVLFNSTAPHAFQPPARYAQPSQQPPPPTADASRSLARNLAFPAEMGVAQHLEMRFACHDTDHQTATRGGSPSSLPPRTPRLLPPEKAGMLHGGLHWKPLARGGARLAYGPHEQVLLFDNAWPESLHAELVSLAARVLQLPRRRERADGLSLRYHDAIHMEHEEASEIFSRLRLGERLQTSLGDASAGGARAGDARASEAACGTLTLVRAYWNVQGFTDMNEPHQDAQAVQADSEAITALLYPHATWQQEWAGQTVFMTPSLHDVLFQASPLPRRLLLFSGTIPHFARPATHEARPFRRDQAEAEPGADLASAAANSAGPAAAAAIPSTEEIHARLSLAFKLTCERSVGTWPSDGAASSGAASSGNTMAGDGSLPVACGVRCSSEAIGQMTSYSISEAVPLDAALLDAASSEATSDAASDVQAAPSIGASGDQSTAPAAALASYAAFDRLLAPAIEMTIDEISALRTPPVSPIVIRGSSGSPQGVLGGGDGASSSGLLSADAYRAWQVPTLLSLAESAQYRVQLIEKEASPEFVHHRDTLRYRGASPSVAKHTERVVSLRDALQIVSRQPPLSSSFAYLSTDMSDMPPAIAAPLQEMLPFVCPDYLAPSAPLRPVPLPVAAPDGAAAAAAETTNASEEEATRGDVGPCDGLKSNIWVGQPSTSTALHYDFEENVFIQAQGEKTFTLLTPAAAANVELHPRWHGSRRQAQRPLPELLASLQPPLQLPPGGTPSSASAGSESASSAGAGSARDEQSAPPPGAWRAHLRAGDALLIPAMVFHHVRSEKLISVGVNVWTNGPALRAWEAITNKSDWAALMSLPAGPGSSSSGGPILGALRRFDALASKFVALVGTPPHSLAARARHLVATRYATPWVSTLGLDGSQADQITALCAKAMRLEGPAAARPEQASHGQLSPWQRQVLEQMGAALLEVDDTTGARSLILDEWVEAWALWCVGTAAVGPGFGPAAVGPFLSSCFAERT